jgi:uncharacterized membrane protein
MAGKVVLGAVGAALMYLADERLGKRRRHIARDKLARAARATAAAAELGLRDLRHRAEGLAWKARRRFRSGAAPDDTIAARVRAALGRVTSRPRQVHVASSGGIVLLSGRVPANELAAVLDTVRSVRGVCGINNDLEVDFLGQVVDWPHALTGSGGALLEGERSHPWSPGARLLATVGGAGLALAGLRNRSLPGKILGVAGIALFLRGVTNFEASRLTGFGPGPHGIDVRKTINLRADIGEVFGFFSHYDNFPLFMRNVKRVRDRGNGRSHWTVAGPAGVPVEWDATVTDFVPHELLAWESVAGAPVAHAGRIRFQETPDGGTRVDIQMRYEPPGGAIGHAVARVLGSDPKSEMDQDLARLKTLIERGRIPHDAAQHPASTAPANQGPPIRGVAEVIAAAERTAPVCTPPTVGPVA